MLRLSRVFGSSGVCRAVWLVTHHGVLCGRVAWFCVGTIQRTPCADRHVWESLLAKSMAPMVSKFGSGSVGYGTMGESTIESPACGGDVFLLATGCERFVFCNGTVEQCFTPDVAVSSLHLRAPSYLGAPRCFGHGVGRDTGTYTSRIYTPHFGLVCGVGHFFSDAKAVDEVVGALGVPGTHRMDAAGVEDFLLHCALDWNNGSYAPRNA